METDYKKIVFMILAAQPRVQRTWGNRRVVWRVTRLQGFCGRGHIFTSRPQAANAIDGFLFGGVYIH